MDREELKYPPMCIAKTEVPYVVGCRFDLESEFNKAAQRVSDITGTAIVVSEIIILMLEILKSQARKMPRKKKKRAMNVFNRTQENISTVQDVIKNVHKISSIRMKRTLTQIQIDV